MRTDAATAAAAWGIDMTRELIPRCDAQSIEAMHEHYMVRWWVMAMVVGMMNGVSACMQHSI